MNIVRALLIIFGIAVMVAILQGTLDWMNDVYTAQNQLTKKAKDCK